MSEQTARTAFGGDPMQPNDVLLARIAAVVKGGPADDQVTRWAAAFKETCPVPVDLLAPIAPEDWHATPPAVRVHLHSPHHHRATLSQVASAVAGEASEAATKWAVTILKHISKGAK